MSPRSLHLQVNHRTHLSSPPKTETSGTPPAFDKVAVLFVYTPVTSSSRSSAAETLGLSPEMATFLNETNLDLPLLWGFPQLTVGC